MAVRSGSGKAGRGSGVSAPAGAAPFACCCTAPKKRRPLRAILAVTFWNYGLNRRLNWAPGGPLSRRSHAPKIAPTRASSEGAGTGGETAP